MQLLRPSGAVAEGMDRSLLKREGLVEINHSFHLSQSTDQGFSTDGEGQPKTTEAPTFRKRKKFDPPFLPPRTAQQHRCLPLKRQIDIGIVVSDHHLMTDASLHRSVQKLLGPGLTGGVMGITEHKQLEAVP